MAKKDYSKIFKLSAKEIELRIKRGQAPFVFKNTDKSSSFATPTSQKSPAGKLRDEGGSAARIIRLKKENLKKGLLGGTRDAVGQRRVAPQKSRAQQFKKERYGK
jgi:hypothetical protein